MRKSRLHHRELLPRQERRIHARGGLLCEQRTAGKDPEHGGGGKHNAAEDHRLHEHPAARVIPHRGLRAGAGCVPHCR